MNSTIFSRFLRVLRAMILSTKTKAKGMENGVDFPCHSTNSNPHDVLRAIKVLKEDEKHIVVGFRHLQ